jgi:tetratricopeptide (TPR) repeat protein
MLAGRTYFATGASREAETSFRAVLESDPSHLPAYAALGQLYFKEQKLEAAVREFEALSARNPKNVGSLIVSGMLLESMGRKADAQKRYERALQIDPTSPVAANNLAWMYAESGGNLDVALQLARTAHSKLPNSPEIGDTLGYIYYKKSLYPQAIQILKETVSKEPTKHSAHFRLGMAMAKSGDKTGATLHLKQALALNSTFEGAREASETLRSLETR